jgi:hypothetical protein
MNGNALTQPAILEGFTKMSRTLFEPFAITPFVLDAIPADVSLSASIVHAGASTGILVVLGRMTALAIVARGVNPDDHLVDALS